MQDKSVLLNVGGLWYPIRSLGYGERLGIWLQGCRKRCKDCISPEFQPMERVNICTIEDILNFVPETERIDGLTISGGEPFEQSEGLLELVKMFSQRYTDDILIFTGYTLEELYQKESPIIEEILQYIAVLIDGEYSRELNNGVGLRGSSNQNIHIFKHEERYLDAEYRRRTLQCVLTAQRLWMIGIPPK